MTKVFNIQEEIEELKDRLNFIRGILNRLADYPSLTKEDLIWLNREEAPKIPIYAPDIKFPLDQWPKTGNNCSKCGFDFSGITGYVCGASDCPIQLKIT